MQLVLASQSPRRSELLAALGVRFRVETASVSEWEEERADPVALVTHNARIKGAAVAERHAALPVLSADTTVSCDGVVLNKPMDAADAVRMLRHLSGRTHDVFTAVCLTWRLHDVAETIVVRSGVRFRKLDDARIAEYLDKVHTLDKAGGYAIQEHGELIVEGYEGSLSNIIGLPLDEVRELLARNDVLDQVTNAADDGNP